MEGLRGAAHLNGREGTVVMRAAANPERVVVCLTDGTEVKPKHVNRTRLMYRLTVCPPQYTQVSVKPANLDYIPIAELEPRKSA